MLETGGVSAYQLKDGWLNRLLPLLPKSDAQAIALSATIPAALRGPVEVTSYAPSFLPDASEDMKTRVAAMYASDPQLGELWRAAMSTQAMVGDSGGADAGKRDPGAIGALAAKLLTGPGSARIAMIETSGWDTHYAQPARLNVQLKALDSIVASMRAGLGDSWNQTLVLVATEFGRTAAANGTEGTDHGTASAAMLIGGAVQGGRVVADWPGLAAAKLYEGRDLKPTADLDLLIASALAEHYALDPARTTKALFPDMPSRAPIAGLVRA